MNYYPKWVYSANESTTRANKKEYDRRNDLYWKERYSMEKTLGRKLDLKERQYLREKYSL